MIKLNSVEFEKLSKQEKKDQFCGFLKYGDIHQCYIAGKDEEMYASHLSSFSVSTMHGVTPESKKALNLTVEELKCMKNLFNKETPPLGLPALNTLMKMLISNFEELNKQTSNN
jgi:hypothetical protein